MLGRTLRARKLFSRGQRLAAQGHLETAVMAYEQALALCPRLAGLHLHYALALSDLDRLPEAVAAMQQALMLTPDHPVLPMFVGQIYFDHTDYAQATVWCTRALALSPHNPYALGLQALVALVTGQVQQACEQFTQPIPLPISCAERVLLWIGRSRLPSLLQQANAALQSRVLLSIETLLLQQAPRVRTLSQQLVELSEEAGHEGPGNRLLGWLDQGCIRVLMGLRRLATAVSPRGSSEARVTKRRLLQAEEAMYLGQAATAEHLYAPLAKGSQQLFIRERLCELCYVQGKFPEALRHVRYVLTQVPAGESPNAWQCALLGELLYNVGAYTEAYTALQQGVEHRLRDYKVFYFLGLCQLRRGAVQAARRSFAAAVEQLNPDIVNLRLDELRRLSQPLPYTAS